MSKNISLKASSISSFLFLACSRSHYLFAVVIIAIQFFLDSNSIQQQRLL